MSSKIGQIIIMLTGCAWLAACDVKTTEDPRCGDGRLQSGEDCDGADLAGRTCVNYDFYGGDLACNDDCTLDFSACYATGACGDGVIQTSFGESCDGDALGDQTCESRGLAGGVLACTEDCTFDVTGCAICGDGTIMDPFETCEGDDLQGSSCASLGYYGGVLSCDDQTCTLDTANCATYGICGDNEIQADDEACDGANLNDRNCEAFDYYGGALSCGADCQFNFSSCIEAGRCGDGILQTWREDCDGTEFGGETCRSLRHWSGTALCNGDCQINGCLDVEQIAAGASHSCALISDGTVRCWGGNQFGQLGDGTTVNRLTPVQVAGLTNIKQIAVGSEHSCALSNSNGLVTCWGGNTVGQLGDGTTINRSTPVQVGGLVNIQTVQLGMQFSCALMANDTVRCWGGNAQGQLGDGSTTDRSTPVAVLAVSNVTQLTTGGMHACILASGSVWCWGANALGQLGDNSTVDRHSPVQTTTGKSLVSAGQIHTCAIDNASQVFCWGSNQFGQLGTGDLVSLYVPTQVPGIATVTQVSAGEQHTCALLQDETMRCWGGNLSGQLGNGTTTLSMTPITVPGLATVGSIDVHAVSCAVSLYGEALCWGPNLQGQVGDGTTTNRTSPTLLSE
ncbi:hypothetical protein KKD52_05465 [Myxococcota bacterium]|nr:hypothetical protein [Myxococcota bacterium]MBU1410318.1 hypothetical protein [Myxococcota bacterium]MBU1509788.1 hypothetical protein [Myxococcota bacterium]